MTQEQAQVLALACLTKRWSGTLGRIREREVLERGIRVGVQHRVHD